MPYIPRRFTTILKFISKWLLISVSLFALISALMYLFIQPKQDRDWTIEHAILPKVGFSGDPENPNIRVRNIRDFKWSLDNKTDQHQLLNNKVHCLAVSPS